MDIAQVSRKSSDDFRRVARATALLLTGAALHVWLFPFTGGPPSWFEKLSADVESAAPQEAVATAGSSGGVFATALGSLATPPAQLIPTRRTTERNRVTVLVQTVHPTLITSPIPALPLMPAGSLIAQALVSQNPRYPEIDAIEHPVSATRTELRDAADLLPPAALEPEPRVRDSTRPIAVVALSGARQAAAVYHGKLEHVEPPSDERLVTYVLQQYRHAYESLDVSAAQTIWPTVDARALGAAFRQLAGQRVTFDSCGVSVSGSGAQATARCRGQAEYLPKVGSRRAFTASGEWVFDLEKENAAWRIINANANIKP